jgi:hypothetical protein
MLMMQYQKKINKEIKIPHAKMKDQYSNASSLTPHYHVFSQLSVMKIKPFLHQRIAMLNSTQPRTEKSSMREKE